MKRGWTKRLSQVAAREQAATEAITKATRPQAGANRVRDDLRSKIEYLRARISEIAA